jgi:CheY-like chemotaxis protein
MEKRTALVVDDEADIRDHLSAILDGYGFEVITAEDGASALRLASERRPAIIILDINLPDIDGGEVANRLSQDPQTSTIPIIYLTGLITKEEKREPEKLGKHFVIAKPVLKGELLSTISRALKT